MQTAVKGEAADSEDAVILPIEHEAARQFRDEHYAAGTYFWCGTVNGCGRRLIPRIGEKPPLKIPHFYHQGETDVSCRLGQKNRGDLDIEAPVVWAHLRRWRVSRGLPEGEVSFFDPIDHHDARYMHIRGLPGTHDTRIVLGDVTIISVLQDAKSPQGRKWDWFVHQRNTELRSILNEQGISYALIRFTPTENSATMQVFLAAADNVGDWGRVDSYEPAPNRSPRPPAPTRPVEAAPKPVPAQAPSPARAPAHDLARERGGSDSLEDMRIRIARMRSSDGEPGPSQQHAPAVKTPAPRSDGQLPDEFAEAIAHLKEALALGNRRNRDRYARRLRALRKDHRAQLSRDDNREIRDLLRQASTSA